MAEKDVVPGSETMRAPAGPPPHNHGRTVAAWTTTWVVVAGFLIAAVGLVATARWLFWVGAVVAVLGPVVGKVLQAAGLGKGGSDAGHGAGHTGH